MEFDDLPKCVCQRISSVFLANDWKRPITIFPCFVNLTCISVEVHIRFYVGYIAQSTGAVCWSHYRNCIKVLSFILVHFLFIHFFRWWRIIYHLSVKVTVHYKSRKWIVGDCVYSIPSPHLGLLFLESLQRGFTCKLISWEFHYMCTIEYSFFFSFLHFFTF